MARRSIPCVVAAMLAVGMIGGAGAFMGPNPSSALQCLHSLRSCIAKASPATAVAEGMKSRQRQRSFQRLVLNPQALSGQRKMSQGGGYAWGSSLWLPAIEVGSGGGRGGGIASQSGRGGEGGGDDGEEGEEGSIAALLKQYGLVASQLPKGAEALDPKILKRFLDSYSNGLNRWLIDLWPAWRDKMLADPEFAYKMFVEETVGLGLAMSGTVAARGADLLKELDFFLTDCAVGAVLNFVLIWLLAPSVAKAAAPGAFSSAISKLPAFVLAEGKYSIAQRVGSGLYKGSLFGACGFLGSVGGTTFAYLLFQIRKLASKGQQEDKPLPNVVFNSLGWASFMFVSTNPRYQVVNGLEQAMYKVLPLGLSKGGSLLMRTGNNVIGGATWVMWARLIGLQKQKPEEQEIKGQKGKSKGKK